MRAQGGTTDPWLKTGALKGFLDGALGTHTAALLAPYSDDPSTSGILTMDPEKVKAMAIERDRLGFQIAFHAIGDKANRVALDTFESLVRVNPPRDRRDRIEHAQVVAPEDMPRFGKLQVIASMQPSHETNDMRWAEQRLGPERSKGAYAWKSLQNAGARLAFGTDYDVEPINPLRGLYACVTREGDRRRSAGGWIPQEKLPLADCISAYTSGSAYAEFMEGKKGELKVGEFADFVVLSQDLTKIEPREFLQDRSASHRRQRQDRLSEELNRIQVADHLFVFHLVKINANAAALPRVASRCVSGILFCGRHHFHSRNILKTKTERGGADRDRHFAGTTRTIGSRDIPLHGIFRLAAMRISRSRCVATPAGSSVDGFAEAGGRSSCVAGTSTVFCPIAVTGVACCSLACRFISATCLSYCSRAATTVRSCCAFARSMGVFAAC